MGGVGSGGVEEDDGAVGETGAFAEGGWCCGGLVEKGTGARGENAQYAEVRLRRERRSVRYGRRSEGRVMVWTLALGRRR